MDLGLKALSDDQLVNLLRETLSEFASREKFVREAAQRVISDEGERLKHFRNCLTQAVTAVRKQYEQQLESEVFQFVVDGVKDGSIKILDSSDEAQRIVEASNFAQEAIDKIVSARKLKRGAPLSPLHPDWYGRGGPDPEDVRRALGYPSAY